MEQAYAHIRITTPVKASSALLLLLFACCAGLAMPATALAGTTGYGQGYFEVLTSPEQTSNDWWSQVFKVDDEWVYCVQPHSDFEAGLTVQAQDPVAAGIWSQEFTTRLALVSEFIWSGRFRAANGTMVTDNYYKFAVTQIFVWSLIENRYFGCNYEPGGARLVGNGDNSAEMWAWVDANMNNYIGHANYYDTGNYQDVAAGFWLEKALGQISLAKHSGNAALTEGNGCYSLSGASYGIFRSKADAETADRSKAVYVGVTGQKNQDGSQAADYFNTGMTLEVGNWWIRELEASPGFSVDTTVYQASVKSSQDARVNPSKGYVVEQPLHAPVDTIAGKADAQMEAGKAQGSATLAGAEFTVRYYAGYHTASSLPSAPTRTWVFATDGNGLARYDDSHKKSGDALYRDAGGAFTLPLGTISVTETKAPVGYRLDDGAGNVPRTYVAQVVADSGSGQGAKVKPLNYTSFAGAWNMPLAPDSIKHIGFKVSKTDSLLQAAQAEGDATLEGAAFSVVNASEGPVMVGGTLYQPGEVCATAVTAKEGGAFIAKIDGSTLPFGRYTITESSAPEGYLLNEVWSAEIRVDAQTPDGKVFDFTASACNETPVRGGIEIPKIDRELQDATPLGAATLGGAEISITLASEQPVVVDGSVFHTGDVVKTVITDEDGRAATGAEDLPYGTYSLREVKAPQGYLVNSTWEAVAHVREDGELATAEAVSDQVKRGDMCFRKVNGSTMQRLGGVAFLVTSTTTGESHVLVTDENGYLDTSSSWTAHSHATNENDKALLDEPEDESEDESESSSPSASSSSSASSTSIASSSSSTASASSTTASSPQTASSSSTISAEGASGASSGTAATDSSSSSSSSGAGNPDEESKSSSSTQKESDEASEFSSEGEDDDHESEPSSPKRPVEVDTDLLDPEAGVWFSGSGEYETQPDDSLPALPYDTYTVKELACAANEGLDLVEFEIRVCRHECQIDLGTIDDTPIAIPAILTELTGSGAMKSISACSPSKLTDTVFYSGLRPGALYTVKGTLMDKASAEKALVDGEPLSGETEFRARADSGSVEVTFDLNPEDMAEGGLVAFEELYDEDGTLIAEHEDIDDEDQSVPLPSIATTLTASDGSKTVVNAEGSVTLIDRVDYSGLEPGQTYLLSAELHCKDDADADGGVVSDSDGKPVVAEKEFTPETSTGSETVEFAFSYDASLPLTAVAFERLYANGELHAMHEDIHDEEQTALVSPGPPKEETPEPEPEKPVEKEPEKPAEPEPTVPAEKAPEEPQKTATPKKASSSSSREKESVSSSSSRKPSLRTSSSSASAHDKTGNPLATWWWVPLPLFAALALACVYLEMKGRRPKW